MILQPQETDLRNALLAGQKTENNTAGPVELGADDSTIVYCILEIHARRNETFDFTNLQGEASTRRVRRGQHNYRDRHIMGRMFRFGPEVQEVTYYSVETEGLRA